MKHKHHRRKSNPWHSITTSAIKYSYNKQGKAVTNFGWKPSKQEGTKVPNVVSKLFRFITRPFRG